MACAEGTDSKLVAQRLHLTPVGNAFVEGFTERSFLDAVTFWERSMNHWLATGARLPRG